MTNAAPSAQHHSPQSHSHPPASGSRGGAWRRRLGWSALALLLVGLAFGIEQHAARHEAALAAVQRHEDFVPNVRVEEVHANDNALLVTLPGTTEAFAAANIYARASGYIDKRYVDIGSRVKAGQLMAQITAPELDHQIAQAEASLAQAEDTLRQTQANRDLAHATTMRTSKLSSLGWVTKEQGDTDRYNYLAQEHAASAAQANISALQAQIMVLRQQKAYQQVAAPFDGVVIQRNIDVGSLVQADAASGTSMFTLMQSDVIRIQLYVPQDAAIGVAPGVDAVVHVPEIPSRGFPGKVTRIADALQPATRTLLTEIDVPNPDGALVPGVYCTVDLHIPRKMPALIVPADAVVFNRNGLQVFVAENGMAHIRKIDVVRDYGTSVEVNSGVKQGDQVILNPPVDLAENSRVQIQQAPATSTP